MVRGVEGMVIFHQGPHADFATHPATPRPVRRHRMLRPPILPRIPTQLAWTVGIEHITENRDLWPLLWDANRAVAEAYGLNAADLDHILSAFPVFARKHPDFFAYLKERLERWRVET
jgi:hypothetical protein